MDTNTTIKNTLGHKAFDVKLDGDTDTWYWEGPNELVGWGGLYKTRDEAIAAGKDRCIAFGQSFEDTAEIEAARAEWVVA